MADVAPPGELLEVNASIDEDRGTPLETEQAFDENDDDAGSSDDDDIQIRIGDIKPNVPFQAIQKGIGSGGAVSQAAGKLDIDQTAELNGQPIYDVNVEDLEDKPWRKPGADLTDYFNYGFNEDTWNNYCERQRKLRAEYGNQAQANKVLFSKMMGIAAPPQQGIPILQQDTKRMQQVPVLGMDSPKLITVNLAEKYAQPRTSQQQPIFRMVLTGNQNQGQSPSTGAIPVLGSSGGGGGPSMDMPPPSSMSSTPHPSDAPPGVDMSEPAVPGASTPPPGADTPPVASITSSQSEVNTAPRPIPTLGGGAMPIDTSVPPPRFNVPPPQGPVGMPNTNLPPPPFGQLLPPGVSGPPPGFGPPRFPPPGVGGPPFGGPPFGFGGPRPPHHMQHDGERSPASYSDKSSGDEGDLHRYRRGPRREMGGPRGARRSRSRSRSPYRRSRSYRDERRRHRSGSHERSSRSRKSEKDKEKDKDKKEDKDKDKEKEKDEGGEKKRRRDSKKDEDGEEKHKKRSRDEKKIKQEPLSPESSSSKKKRRKED